MSRLTEAEEEKSLAAKFGHMASSYMDGEQSRWGIALWRAYDLAKEAARHAFLARPDLRGEA